MLRCAKDLENLVLEIGLLPFFSNEIEGYSVEEYTPSDYWFSDDREGPWEWKGPVASGGRVVYGKFFHGRAGFISLEWFPDFVNFRRDGYDFDARCDEGLVPAQDLSVYQTLLKDRADYSRDLKWKAGYGRGGHKGFDTVITRLQMQTYVNIQDFRQVDRDGRIHPWGIAIYTTPEQQFGRKIVRSAYRRSPEASRQRLIRHLCASVPGVQEAQIIKLLK